MPLVCLELSGTELYTINHILQEKPLHHALRKESMDGHVAVATYSGSAVFHSAGGFSFRRIRESLYETILEEIHSEREYICSVLELLTPSMVPAMLDRFVETHGRNMANKIDHLVIERDGKTLMLINFPSCVIRHMMSYKGGRMTTGFSGAVNSLLKVPMLAKYGNVGGTGIFRGCIATEYKEGGYDHARKFHFGIVQEVISRPGLGITLSPIASWDA